MGRIEVPAAEDSRERTSHERAQVDCEAEEAVVGTLRAAEDAHNPQVETPHLLRELLHGPLAWHPRYSAAPTPAPTSYGTASKQRSGAVHRCPAGSASVKSLKHRAALRGERSLAGAGLRDEIWIARRIGARAYRSLPQDRGRSTWLRTKLGAATLPNMGPAAMEQQGEEHDKWERVSKTAWTPRAPRIRGPGDR